MKTVPFLVVSGRWLVGCKPQVVGRSSKLVRQTGIFAVPVKALFGPAGINRREMQAGS